MSSISAGPRKVSAPGMAGNGNAPHATRSISYGICVFLDVYATCRHSSMPVRAPSVKLTPIWRARPSSSKCVTVPSSKGAATEAGLYQKCGSGARSSTATRSAAWTCRASAASRAATPPPAMRTLCLPLGCSPLRSIGRLPIVSLQHAPPTPIATHRESPCSGVGFYGSRGPRAVPSPVEPPRASRSRGIEQRAQRRHDTLCARSPRGTQRSRSCGPASEHVQQLEGARDRMAEHGVAAMLVPAHGDPVEAILEIADEVDADLIVLGSHERSLIERALGISVSGAVARKAHRDVLIAH